MDNVKCPHCGSGRYTIVETDPNIKYALMEVDISKEIPVFKMGHGIPADLYGCKDCKSIILKNEDL